MRSFASRFEIGSSTGAITYVGSGEDYEGFGTPASAFTLTVRASDGTAHAAVTVTMSAVTPVRRSDTPIGVSPRSTASRQFPSNIRLLPVGCD